MRPLLALPLLVACAAPDEEVAPSLAADEDPALRADALVPHLEALFDIALAHDGHRAVGSAGYLASVTWAEETLRGLGLEPRREPLDVASWDVDDATLTLDGAPPADDFSVLEWSAPGSVRGEVVAVDLTLPPSPTPNTSTSGCDPSDFDGFPAGAIALVQRGGCTFADKAALADAAGASAVLVFNEGQPGRTDVVFGVLDEAAPPSIPVLGLSFADGAALADGASAALTVDATTSRTETWNVLAELPGESGLYWVVGAHLDSVPAGPGINDNGTGVALVLQLAARLAGTRPTHGVRFALWGAEEVGLVGSLAHTRALDQAGASELLGNLNFDMVGSPHPGRFVYDGDGSDLRPSLELDPGSAVVEALFTRHFDALGLAHAPTAFEGRTDYVGFALLGLPVGGTFTGAEARRGRGDVALWGGEAGVAFDPCYHLGCDTVDNVDLATHEEMTLAAAVVLEQLVSGEVEAARRAPDAARRDLPVRLGRGCADAHAPPITR